MTHSFPTRRSSDLLDEGLDAGAAAEVAARLGNGGESFGPAVAEVHQRGDRILRDLTAATAVGGRDRPQPDAAGLVLQLAGDAPGELLADAVRAPHGPPVLHRDGESGRARVGARVCQYVV